MPKTTKDGICETCGQDRNTMRCPDCLSYRCSNTNTAPPFFEQATQTEESNILRWAEIIEAQQIPPNKFEDYSFALAKLQICRDYARAIIAAIKKAKTV